MYHVWMYLFVNCFCSSDVCIHTDTCAFAYIYTYIHVHTLNMYMYIYIHMIVQDPSVTKCLTACLSIELSGQNNGPEVTVEIHPEFKQGWHDQRDHVSCAQIIGSC